MSYIQRCFHLLVDSHNFLELEFKYVALILESSELHIDSELQVFNAASEWLCHKIEERTKHAKRILLRVRLPLLSAPTLNSLLLEKTSFATIDECDELIKEALGNKNKLNLNSVVHRYCTQNSFDILVCGGRQKDLYISKNRNKICYREKKDVCSIKASNFTSVNILPSMTEVRLRSVIACNKDEVYVFGDDIKSIEKYSLTTKTWQSLASEIDLSYLYFGCCSFMDSIYLIGGYDGGQPRSDCLEFNTKTQKCRQIAEMVYFREEATCSVFQGRIVVSGGNHDGGRWETVEAYDHVLNCWSPMPDMNAKRYLHKTCVVKNKMFVVGGCFYTSDCEVFDSLSNMFVWLKMSERFHDKRLFNGVFSIGSRFVALSDFSKTALWYDVENDEWSEETCEVSEHLEQFSCAKIPQL